jgi:hypothetical protein
MLLGGDIAEDVLAGHVTRMGKNRKAQRVSVGEASRKEATWKS